MATPLTGSTVASTYTGLLKTSDNATLTSTLKTVSDGGGTDSALQLATTSVNATGDFSVATSKFTVASASGNTLVAGTLNVTGASTVGSLTTAGNISTSAGTISSYGAITQTQSGQNNSLAGNLAITGNLNVTGATTLTGNLSVPGTLSCGSDFAVNTNKFNVAAASGNTLVAGTLGVTGATTLSSFNSSGAGTIGTTLGVTGNFSVASTKFTVDSATGNTAVAGTLDVASTTTLAGNLLANGNTTIGNASTDLLTVNSNNVTFPNMPAPVTVDLANDNVLITDASDSSKVRVVPANQLGITSSNAPQLVHTPYRGVKTVTAVNTGFGTELTDITSSITPRSTSSRILVQIMLNYGATPLYSQYGVFKLVRNGVEIGSNTTTPGSNGVVGIAQTVFNDSYAQNSMNNLFIQFMDSPSTTSSVTYALYLYSGGFGGKYSVIQLNQTYNDSIAGSLDNSRASSVMTLQEFFA